MKSVFGFKLIICTAIHITSTCLVIHYLYPRPGLISLHNTFSFPRSDKSHFLTIWMSPTRWTFQLNQGSGRFVGRGPVRQKNELGTPTTSIFDVEETLTNHQYVTTWYGNVLLSFDSIFKRPKRDPMYAFIFKNLKKAACTCEMGWFTYTQPVSGLTLRYSGSSLDMLYVMAAFVPKSSSWAATRRKLFPIMVSSRRKSAEGQKTNKPRALLYDSHGFLMASLLECVLKM